MDCVLTLLFVWIKPTPLKRKENKFISKNVQLTSGLLALLAETHMVNDVFINLKESLEQLWPLGLTVGHQEGDESLTVRPP